MSNRLSFAQIIQKKQSNTTSKPRQQAATPHDITQSKYFNSNNININTHHNQQQSQHSLLSSRTHNSSAHPSARLPLMPTLV